MFKKLAPAVLALSLFVGAPASASTLSGSALVDLQVAMQQYIDSAVVDDALLQVDPATGLIKSYFAVKAHPKIMTWGDNIIMCSDFRDEAGNVVMGNFYMTKRNGQYTVFQATFGADPALDKLMKDGKVAMAN